MSFNILTKSNIFLLSFFIIVAVPLFLFLGEKPIQLWDEGRNSINALNMYWLGLSPVTYYNSIPDMWNTKPPLLIWLQVISMKLFGVNEFSIRFPSAFAALLTCTTLFIFCKKYLKETLIGIIAVLVLITSNGYIDIHATRTGDYDALLTFFLTFNVIILFSFIETKRALYLYLFFITLALAVLTKSIAALFFVPAYGLFIIYDKKITYFLKNKHFYIGFLLFVAIVSSFYLIREHINPGYLKAVYENELGGRFNAVTDGETEKNMFYYFYNLFMNEKRYIPWILFLVFGIFIGVFNKNQKKFKLTIFILLILSVHFIVLTISKTKYHWYDTPWYPLMAIIVALALYHIFDRIKNYVTIKGINSLYAYLLLILILGIPYASIVYKVGFSRSSEYDRNINLLSLYFKEVLDGKRNIENGITICSEKPHFNTMFYIEQLNRQGKNIQFSDWKNLSTEQSVLLGHDDRLKLFIEDHYEYEILEDHQSDWNYWGIKKYRILSKIKEF